MSSVAFDYYYPPIRRVVPETPDSNSKLDKDRGNEEVRSEAEWDEPDPLSDAQLHFETLHDNGLDSFNHTGNLFADDKSMDHLIKKILDIIRFRISLTLPATTESLLLAVMGMVKTLAHQTRDALHSHEEELKKARKRQSQTDSDLNLMREAYSSLIREYLVTSSNQPYASVLSNPNHWGSSEFTVWNDTVGEMRLMVVSAFAELLPATTRDITPERREYYYSSRSTGINGIGWSKFMGNVIDYYCAHFLPLFPTNDGVTVWDEMPTWAHSRSVFSNFQNNFFESSYLSPITRRGGILSSSQLEEAIVMNFGLHLHSHLKFTDFSLDPSDLDWYKLSAEERKTSNIPVLALMFFIPLLIWSYNTCKECLVLLDALIEHHQEVSILNSSSSTEANRLRAKTKAEIDYSAVFQFGSAVDVRRQFKSARADNFVKSSTVSDAVEKEDAVQDATKQTNKLSTVNEAGEMEDSVQDHVEGVSELRKERKIFLNKFNLIRKCLIILSNEHILFPLLSFNSLVSDELEFEVAQLTTHLRASVDDYDHDKESLAATEHEFDMFVSAEVGRLRCCKDVEILLLLLEKLNPI